MKTWTLLEKVMLGAFLFWVACGLTFIFFHLTPAVIDAWTGPVWLRDFVGLCLRTGDPVLILLAFANTHLHAARQWTPTIARRWALIIIVASLAVETLGALTGIPFGSYHYSDRFGPSLGVVPLTIPLAWHVVLSNTLFIVRRFSPHSSRIAEAGWAGLLCSFYDFILEPFATLVKGYWTWQGGRIPDENYVAWFVVSGVLIWAFAPTSVTRFRNDPRPIVLLGATIAIFISGRLFAS